MGDYATVTVQVIVTFQQAEEALNALEEEAQDRGLHVLLANSRPLTSMEWAVLEEELE